MHENKWDWLKIVVESQLLKSSAKCIWFRVERVSSLNLAANPGSFKGHELPLRVTMK